jgi:MFS family permease
MTSAALAPKPVTARMQWIVLILLVISVCINYVDRGNISVASYDLKTALNLNPLQLGYLFSAFFWTYAGFMVLAGWMVEKYNVIWVYAIGYLIWSLATALTGLANSFVVLFGLRLLLGMSESVAYPSYSKILAAGFPERQRGMANGLLDAGSKLGPAIGLVVGGSILAHFGWRMLFVSIGVASLVWLVPWCAVAPRIRTKDLKRHKDTPSFGEILRKRSAWGTFLCLFCSNYGWYFMLTWLPGYLRMERHYSAETMALAGSLPFWAVAGGAVFGLAGGPLDSPGRVADQGAKDLCGQRAFAVGGVPHARVGGSESDICNGPAGDRQLFIRTMQREHLGHHTDSGGTCGRGQMDGIAKLRRKYGRYRGPTVTGFIVQETGSFYFAFLWVCFMFLAAACSYLFVVGRVEPVSWQTKPLNPI